MKVVINSEDCVKFTLQIEPENSCLANNLVTNLNVKLNLNDIDIVQTVINLQFDQSDCYETMVDIIAKAIEDWWKSQLRSEEVENCEIIDGKNNKTISDLIISKIG